MRKKFCKKLSLLLAFAMGVSLSSVPAFAAETTEAAASEDGRTTTITTEITWASPEGKEPVVEGAAVTTETTVLDEEGRVIQESGSETGHETTATKTVASGTTVEDKEPVTETTEGETITTETPGEFEKEQAKPDPDADYLDDDEDYGLPEDIGTDDEDGSDFDAEDDEPV